MHTKMFISAICVLFLSCLNHALYLVTDRTIYLALLILLVDVSLFQARGKCMIPFFLWAWGSGYHLLTTICEARDQAIITEAKRDAINKHLLLEAVLSFASASVWLLFSSTMTKNTIYVLNHEVNIQCCIFPVGYSRSHKQERETKKSILDQCHGVFTDWSIFRSLFAGNFK